jgi:GNAT superfamily N-acetyltransferase
LVRCENCKKYFQKSNYDVDGFYATTKGSCRECYKSITIPNITFEYTDDIEGNDNRGWQVDKIEAKIKDEIAGYIKLSYIPKNRFEEYYGNIFNYLKFIHGHHVLPYKYNINSRLIPVTDYRQMPLDELKKNIVSTAIAINGWVDSAEQTRLSKLELQEVVKEYENLEKIAKSRFLRSFKEFKNYHVDKPIVDYIYVENDYRRIGVATKLYRLAHNWMKTKNMKLYSSYVQSPATATEKAWEKMEKEYKVGKEKAKYCRKTWTRRFFAD